MAEYQKFIFSENYSTEPENLQRLQDAKLAEAKSLMAEEVEKAKQFAFEQGFQEGQKMALEKLKTEMDTHVKTIIANLEGISQFKPELQNIYEQHSTACVRHLVNQLYFKAEEIMPGKILEQSIQNALDNLPFVSKIIIKVSRNCKNYLQDTQIEDQIKQRGITDFSFVEDFTLADGQCLIEWDKSGLLSSKVESFEKINLALDAFLSPEDIELSNNTNSHPEKQPTVTEEISQVEQIVTAIEEPEVLEPSIIAADSVNIENPIQENITS